MNGSEATPQHTGYPAYGFSIPSANASNPRRPVPGQIQRSWTDAKPAISSHSMLSSQSMHTGQTSAPGWRVPAVPVRQSTMNFPEPLKLVGASNMERRRSAPAPDYDPLPPPFSAPPHMAQSRSHGRMGFPEPNLYPLGEESHFHYSQDLATTHFAEEPQMITPESATSTLPPATPGHLDLGIAPEFDPIKGDLLEAAVADIKVVQEIFRSWHNQLYKELTNQVETKSSKSSKNRHNLEQEVLLRVSNLLSKADVLLKTSQTMQKTYLRYARITNSRQQHNHRQSEVDTEDAKSLYADLAKDSDEVSKYVNDMRNEIYVLVKTIRDAKEISDKKAARDKHLRIFVRSLKIFNVGVGVGASVSQLAPQPAGLAATVALGTAAVLITCATDATEKYRKAHYSETEFDAALKIVDKDIPDALKKAELTLCSFRATHKHMTLDMSVREAVRSNPNDAESRRKAWQENSLQMEGLPSMFPLTRSTLL